MAGFSIPSQVFGTYTFSHVFLCRDADEKVLALCNQVSTNLLSSPVSGLLGLAYQTIAASKAVPFWQALVQGGSWSQPLMSFVLTRFTNTTNPNVEEPGGVFTMGYVNTSLYTGDIEYTNIPAGSETYWLIPMTCEYFFRELPSTC